MNPGPFTLRQLLWMAEARQRVNWDTAAALLAMTFNVNRDPKKSRPAKPADFHPLLKIRPKSGVPITARNIRVLKKAFVNRKAKGWE